VAWQRGRRVRAAQRAGRTGFNRLGLAGMHGDVRDAWACRRRRCCGVSVRFASREGLRQLSTPSTVRKRQDVVEPLRAVVDVPRAVRRSEAPDLGFRFLDHMAAGVGSNWAPVHTVISAAHAAAYSTQRPTSNLRIFSQTAEVRLKTVARPSAGRAVSPAAASPPPRAEQPAYRGRPALTALRDARSSAERFTESTMDDGPRLLPSLSQTEDGPTSRRG
jgi:hypothetical protein